MPITFEQPDPQGYSALAGVPGQVQQGNLDRQYLMQMQEMGLSAGQHIAALQAQQAAVSSQGGQANAQRATQAAIAGQAGNVSPADIFRANAQQQLQGQHLAAQQAMQAQQFTYQDQVRLSQMNNAMASIDNNSDLSDEEKANYKMQLKTGIDPLVQKQQAAKAAMLQEQAKEVQQQGALQAAHVKAIGQLLTNHPDGVMPLPDGSSLYFDGTSLKHIAAPKKAADPFSEDGEGGTSHASGGGGGDFYKNYHETAKRLTHKDETGVEHPPSSDDILADMDSMNKAADRYHQQQRVRRATAMLDANTVDPSFNLDNMNATDKKNHLMALNIESQQALPRDAGTALQQAGHILATFKNPAALPPQFQQRLVQLNNVVNPPAPASLPPQESGWQKTQPGTVKAADLGIASHDELMDFAKRTGLINHPGEMFDYKDKQYLYDPQRGFAVQTGNRQDPNIGSVARIRQGLGPARSAIENAGPNLWKWLNEVH